MSFPADPEPSELPPKDENDPRYRRYWRYYNRPYPGCGFFWTALLVLLIWLLISILFPRTAQ